MQQPSPAPPQAAAVPARSQSDQTVEAPPKQVALAMDRLSQAGRLIADVRIGADRLLEALIIAASQPYNQSSKSLQLIVKEETSMRQHLQDLRTIGTSRSSFSFYLFLDFNATNHSYYVLFCV